MTKGRKRKDSADENVEAYRHETETRKNVVWTGKAENTSFEVPTISLHIHERIAPEAIIRSIRREPAQQDLTKE